MLCDIIALTIKIWEVQSMANLFFRASEDALDNITDAFDISHPLRVSFRYTRKVLHELTPNTDSFDFNLCHNTINEDGYVHGVNYRRAFFDTTYEDQEERLAWFLLNNLFAIHEGWAERIYNEIFYGMGYNKNTFIKYLEYKNISTKYATYFTPVSKESNILRSAFFSIYQSNSSLDFSKIDNYMICYRFFKEARNCYMHKNFIASQKLIDSYNQYQTIASTNDLDIDEILVTIPPVLGQRVELSIRGVIGFSQIIKRIIVISDTHLLRNKAAEKEILLRKPAKWRGQTLSSNEARAKGQIARYFNKSGLLKPLYSDDLKNYLISIGVFSK